MPHPGSQAVLCINDATGEHMWLPADARCSSLTFKLLWRNICVSLVCSPAAPPQRRSIGVCEATAWLHAHRVGGGPAVGRPTGVSAASWHALASLHKAGSGGSGGSTTGDDNGVKAASAPAVLVCAWSPRNCLPLTGSAQLKCHS